MRHKLLILLSMLSLIVSAQTNHYSGGDGTKENPYLIGTADELANLANDVATIPDFSRGRYFKLTNDIVVNSGVMQNDLEVLQGGKAFPETPAIGNYTSETDYTAFQGTFDGDGHTISGIYMTYAQATNYLALFRVVEDADICNLRINDMFLYAGAYLAGVAARVVNSRIINCSVTDSHIFGWGSNSGGIAGQALGSTKIQNCYVTGKLDGKNDTGGIVGRIGNGDVNSVLVENCYTTVTITNRTKPNMGGVTATNSQGSTVRNCYFTSTSGNDAVWADQDKGTTENCRQMTIEEMQTDDFLALLNGNSIVIPAACRWTKGEVTPVHNYAEATPDAGKRDLAVLATNPYPANGDMHAPVDGATATLRWTLPIDGKTVKQYLYFGTNQTEIETANPANASATLATENSYDVQDLSSMNAYYWRVDREEADGTLTVGDVWSFQPRHLAFPGAEGYGRFARGGRGGKVVYVSSLKDDGSEGTLRWALTNGSGPRTVLFRVSGTIDMNFQQCLVDDQVTIAAQTAPGKGICIKHCGIGLGDDNICRFLRARRGLGDSEDTGNAIGTYYSDHTILDHVTASWGTDETFSSRSSRNITFQRSMISEALGITGHRKYPAGTNHGYAATIGGDIGSFHHNLLADCNGRNWSMGGGADSNGKSQGRLDMFNNVVYNWYGRTTDGGAMEMQFVNNYYKMGPDTKLEILFSADNESGGDRDQFAYVSGNIRENKNGSLTQDKLGVTYRATGPQPEKTWRDTPFWDSFATIETAQAAYKSVMSDVGANQPMSDLTDQRIFYETLNRTYTYIGSKSGIKGEIDNEADAGGFEDYPEELRPVSYDTDYDGLPNWWEEIRGTDPRTRTRDFKETNADTEGDGYTELERYLDFMAQPHIFLTPGQSTTIDADRLFAGYTDQPAYSIALSGTGVTASLSGNVMTVAAGQTKSLTTITLKVQDATGDCYERRLCVAVTDNATVTAITPHFLPLTSHLSPLYNLQGQRVSSENLKPGIYIVNRKKIVIR